MMWKTLRSVSSTRKFQSYGKKFKVQQRKFADWRKVWLVSEELPAMYQQNKWMLRLYGMKYANFCPSCHSAKAKSIKKQGLLRPLPVPQHRWMDITMDFIVDLPVCKRRGRQHRHTMVVVDRLSKDFRVEPLRGLEVEEVFDAMNRRVFSQGLPCSIVLD
jgi:hypothetical protein